MGSPSSGAYRVALALTLTLTLALALALTLSSPSSCAYRVARRVLPVPGLP